MKTKKGSLGLIVIGKLTFKNLLRGLAVLATENKGWSWCGRDMLVESYLSLRMSEFRGCILDELVFVIGNPSLVFFFLNETLSKEFVCHVLKISHTFLPIIWIWSCFHLTLISFAAY